MDKARKDLDQRCFAAAVGPQQPHDLAGGDIERDIVQHLMAAVIFGKVAHLEGIAPLRGTLHGGRYGFLRGGRRIVLLRIRGSIPHVRQSVGLRVGFIGFLRVGRIVVRQIFFKELRRKRAEIIFRRFPRIAFRKRFFADKLKIVHRVFSLQPRQPRLSSFSLNCPSAGSEPTPVKLSSESARIAT